jgi:hypothetical protein
VLLAATSSQVPDLDLVVATAPLSQKLGGKDLEKRRSRFSVEKYVHLKEYLSMDPKTSSPYFLVNSR